MRKIIQETNGSVRRDIRGLLKITNFLFTTISIATYCSAWMTNIFWMKNCKWLEKILNGKDIIRCYLKASTFQFSTNFCVDLIFEEIVKSLGVGLMISNGKLLQVFGEFLSGCWLLLFFSICERKQLVCQNYYLFKKNSS